MNINIHLKLGQYKKYSTSAKNELVFDLPRFLPTLKVSKKRGKFKIYLFFIQAESFLYRLCSSYTQTDDISFVCDFHEQNNGLIFSE